MKNRILWGVLGIIGGAGLMFIGCTIIFALRYCAYYGIPLF